MVIKDLNEYSITFAEYTNYNDTGGGWRNLISAGYSIPIYIYNLFKKTVDEPTIDVCKRVFEYVALRCINAINNVLHNRLATSDFKKIDNNLQDNLRYAVYSFIDVVRHNGYKYIENRQNASIQTGETNINVSADEIFNYYDAIPDETMRYLSAGIYSWQYIVQNDLPLPLKNPDEILIDGRSITKNIKDEIQAVGLIKSDQTLLPVDRILNTDDNQIVNGIITFNTIPKTSLIPSTPDDLVNRAYVDAHAGAFPPDDITLRNNTTSLKLEAIALKRTSDILNANNIADLTSQQTINGYKHFIDGIFFTADLIDKSIIVDHGNLTITSYSAISIGGLVGKILIQDETFPPDPQSAKITLLSNLAPQIISTIEPSLDDDIATVKYVNDHAGTQIPDGITCHNILGKLEVIGVKTTAGVVGGDNIADLTSAQTFTGNKDFTGGNNRFILTDANKFLRIGHDVQGEEITFNDHQVNFPSIWTVKFQGIVEALDPTTPQQVANRNYVDSNFPKKTDFDNLTIVTSSSFGNKWTAMANVKVFGNDDPNTVPRGYCITGSTNIPFGWSTVGSSVLGFGHVKHSGGSIQIALGFSNVNNGLMATRSTVNTSSFTAWDTVSTPFRHRERFVLATGQILATVSTAFSIASTIKQGRYATALLSNQYVIPPVAVVGDFLSIKFDLQMTINSGANPNIEFVLWNATTGAQLGNTRIFQYSNQAGNTTFDFATIPFAINTTTLKIGDHLEVRYRLTNTSTAYSILPNSYIFWEIERGV